MAASQRPSFPRRLLRFVGRLALWATATLALVLSGTAAYARILHRQDAGRWKAPGRLVEVEPGRRMHLYCTGSGTPTLVLEAGLGDFSVGAWSTVQPQLSGITRTCSYDRAGTGWSDAPSVEPTPTAMVDDLHALLTRSGEPGPYVMVGHSLGGPIIRHHAVHYPADVAGLVLVDGSHEDQIERMKGMPAWSNAILKAVPVIHALGIDRVAAGAAAKDTLEELSAAMSTSDKAMENTAELGANLAGFLAEVKRDARPFGDLPITALTAGRMEIPGVDPAVAKGIHVEWVKMHQEIVSRTTRGRWILAEKSTHYIQKDQPELVIGAVRDMVDVLRATPVAGKAPGA